MFDKYSGVTFHQVKDPDEPTQPRERFRCLCTQAVHRYHKFEKDRQVVLANLISAINNICLSFYAEGIFPQTLWDVDHDVGGYFRQSEESDIELIIRLPRWISHWIDCGEFLTPHQAQEHVDAKVSL